MSLHTSLVEDTCHGSVARNEQNLAFWMTLLDENGHIHTVQPWHKNIADYQVRWAKCDLCQRTFSVVEHVGFMPSAPQYYCKQVSYAFLIVDNKDSFSCHFLLS